MYKPEVTEELSVGGSLQPILGCADTWGGQTWLQIRITCGASTILMLRYWSPNRHAPGVILTRRLGRELLGCCKSLLSMGYLLVYQKLTQVYGNV